MKIFRLRQPLALLCLALLVLIVLCLSTSVLQASGSQASAQEAKAGACLTAPLANTHTVQRTVTHSRTCQTVESTVVVVARLLRQRSVTRSNGCAANCNTSCNCANQQAQVGPVAPLTKPATPAPQTTAAPAAGNAPPPVVDAPAPATANVFQRTVTRTRSRSSTCVGGLCATPR